MFKSLVLDDGKFMINKLTKAQFCIAIAINQNFVLFAIAFAIKFGDCDQTHFNQKSRLKFSLSFSCSTDLVHLSISQQRKSTNKPAFFILILPRQKLRTPLSNSSLSFAVKLQ